MYKVTSNFNTNIIYVFGIHHNNTYDELDSQIKTIIDECDTLVLETDIDAMNLCIKENIIPLKDRIDINSYELIGEYLDIEEAEYANFDTVIKIMIFFMMRDFHIGEIENHTFLERTLWDKFTSKVSLELVEEHQQRAISIAGTLISKHDLDKLVENELKYDDIRSFIDTIVDIMKEVKEIMSADYIIDNIDVVNDIICQNDTKMVDRIHKYNLNTNSIQKILIVTGIMHTNNIIDGLLRKEYKVI